MSTIHIRPRSHPHRRFLYHRIYQPAASTAHFSRVQTFLIGFPCKFQFIPTCGTEDDFQKPSVHLAFPSGSLKNSLIGFTPLPANVLPSNGDSIPMGFALDKIGFSQPEGETDLLWWRLKI